MTSFTFQQMRLALVLLYTKGDEVNVLRIALSLYSPSNFLLSFGNFLLDASKKLPS